MPNSLASSERTHADRSLLAKSVKLWIQVRSSVLPRRQLSPPPPPWCEVAVDVLSSSLCKWLNPLFFYVKREVFVRHLSTSPATSFLYTASFPPEISPMTMVSSVNLTTLVLGWVDRESDMKRVYSMGLSTQACGIPFMMTIWLDVLFISHSDWLESVGTPREWSLLESFAGTTVLSAELLISLRRRRVP